MIVIPYFYFLLEISFFEVFINRSCCHRYRRSFNAGLAVSIEGRREIDLPLILDQLMKYTQFECSLNFPKQSPRARRGKKWKHEQYFYVFSPPFLSSPMEEMYDCFFSKKGCSLIIFNVVNYSLKRCLCPLEETSRDHVAIMNEHVHFL